MISCINATLTSVEFVVLLSNSLVSVDHDIYLQQTISLVHAGEIIRDGERKSWDPPMIWDNFSITPPRRHISAQIHAHVVGSREDVTLRYQMMRVARFPWGLFTVIAREKAGNKVQGSYMQFYALS